MLRTPLKNCVTKTLLARKQCQLPLRNQSTSGERSGGGFGKVVAVTGGALALGIGGAAAYAKFDRSFRSQVEETIPYADKALALVIGEPESQPAKPSQTPAVKSSKPEQSLLQKKLQREETSKSTSSTKNDQVKQAPTPTQIVTAPAPPLEDSFEKSSAPLSAAKPSQSNSPLVGSSTQTIARQEELKSQSAEPLKSKSIGNQTPVAGSTKDDLNEEIREQLKLQLAAYTDYLKEQLHLQEQELGRLHSVVLEERLVQEKMRYQQELAGSIARLQEIERVLSVREKLDAEEHKARELWLLCQILNDSLKSNPAGSVKTEPRKIINEINAVIDKVKQSEENSLAQVALKSLPKAALENGVYTEDALIVRFTKVDKLCKRVALIGDEGGSLWRYLLSYIQAGLVIDRKTISKEELEDKEVDPSAWDTYAILARVRHHLAERNLEMSLRYANQLRGEPRKVASDWIRDVRTHLETRQSANILLAQAASVSIRTLNN